MSGDVMAGDTPTLPTITAEQAGVKTSVAHPPMTVNWPNDVPGVIIQLSRWMSLRHRIANCRRQLSWWALFGSAFFGSFVSLGPAAWSDVATASKWVWTGNTVCCVASGVLALVFWRGYRDTAQSENDSIWSAVYEMDGIARECGHNPDATPSPFTKSARLRRVMWSWLSRGAA